MLRPMRTESARQTGSPGAFAIAWPANQPTIVAAIFGLLGQGRWLSQNSWLPPRFVIMQVWRSENQVEGLAHADISVAGIYE